MARSIPVIGRYDHATRQGRQPGLPTKHASFRCLFGMHELVVYESWWLEKLISRRTLCFRCGSVQHIWVPDSAN